MKSAIGVYESHDKAIAALKALENAGYSTQKISLIGQADLNKDHLHIKNSQTPEAAEVGVGVVAGSVIGILTGIGVFAIPGLGFLFGAGALVGAIAGLNLGLIGGGVVAILTSIGVDSATAAKYEQQLREGKFMVVVQGSEDEVKRAQDILNTHGTHIDLDEHYSDEPINNTLPV